MYIVHDSFGTSSALPDSGSDSKDLLSIDP